MIRDDFFFKDLHKICASYFDLEFVIIFITLLYNWFSREIINIFIKTMKKKKIVRTQIYIDSLRIYYKFIMKKKINSYINLFFIT